MSETTTTRKAVKKALMGATLLATSPVWAKGGGQGDAAGGKSQIGVNHLSLDETPGLNATVCTSPDDVNGKTGSNFTANDIDIAVDPFESSFIEIVFSVRDIIAHDSPHILFLVTSAGIMPEGSPAFPTPKSLNELRLRTSDIEVIAQFDIPAQSLLSQNVTRLGKADPAPHSTVAFSVNLGTDVLTRFLEGSNKAYVQAALIPAEDFGVHWDRIILSELDTIGFVKMSCPEGDASMAVDDQGTLTVTDTGGDVLKTTVTASAEASATVINFGEGKGGSE